MSILSTLEQPGLRAAMGTILGDGGMGKTTLAAMFPSPVFIRTEDGMASLGDNAPAAFPVADTSQMVIDQLNGLGKEDHPFKTVVIDSVTKLDRMIEAEIVEADPKAKSINQAMGGYGSGNKAVAERHRQIKDLCDKLNRHKGMFVIFIGHADSETVEPPDQDAYTRYTLRMHRHSVAHYSDDVDFVAFIKLKTFTRGDGDKKKAISDGTRILTCHPVASHISKNRYGIDADLEFGLGVNPLEPFIPALQPNQPQTEAA